MLEESYRRGHREFDFSRSAQDYKTLYATRVRLLGTEGRPPLRVRAARRSRANIKMILGLHEPSLNLARGIVRSLRNADFDEFVRRKLWATSLEAIGRTFEKASHLIAKDTRSGRQPTLGRRPEGNLQRDRCEEFLETAPEQPRRGNGA